MLRKNKMGWKNWPTWLKGGVIASLFYLIILIILGGLYLINKSVNVRFFALAYLLIIIVFIFLPLGSLGLLEKGNLFGMESPSFDLLGWFILVLIYFLIGAIIGFIIGKIKNKRRYKNDTN